jgi:3-hydroxyisobutyrate dehydrogenase-like beta-hydroxyacid dehydrogenase
MRIGVIGLGNMGAAMARNIRAAGFHLTVYDVREEAMAGLERAGASRGQSPAEVARTADVVLTSLPGPDQVASVTVGPQGVLEGIRRDAVLVETSTSRPTLIRDVARRFAGKGAHVLDAPVSGGKEGAENRNLAVMVGGSREIFDRVRPVLDAIGDKVFYAGAIGAGSVAKLVHNMIGHSIRQALAEGLTLGVKAGVEAEALWECVRRGAVGRMHYLHEALPATMFRDAYTPAAFTLELALKDLSLATELAREVDVPVPVAGLVEEMVREGLDRGWGQLDNNVVVRLQEEAAGAPVRAPGIDLARAARFITTHPEA